jgi:nucleoside-diphosphate-sugar epimerase
MSEKFVITGGVGFIGSNQDVRFLKRSLTDRMLLKEAFVGADCVFHQAAIASIKKSSLWQLTYATQEREYAA